VDAVAAAALSLAPAVLDALDRAYTPRPYVDLPWTARNQQVLTPR
jgi:hypothetical protein